MPDGGFVPKKADGYWKRRKGTAVSELLCSFIEELFQLELFCGPDLLALK